jgi:hypothetical protein
MGLLASFLENEKSESAPATVATVATFSRRQNQKWQESRLSQIATAKTEITCRRTVATVATVAGGDGESAILEARADASLEPDEVDLGERKAMAMASVPEPYLDAWSRL